MEFIQNEWWKAEAEQLRVSRLDAHRSTYSLNSASQQISDP